MKKSLLIKYFLSIKPENLTKKQIKFLCKHKDIRKKYYKKMLGGAVAKRPRLDLVSEQVYVIIKSNNTIMENNKFTGLLDIQTTVTNILLQESGIGSPVTKIELAEKGRGTNFTFYVVIYERMSTIYGVRSCLNVKNLNMYSYLSEITGHDIQMSEMKEMSAECLNYAGIYINGKYYLVSLMENITSGELFDYIPTLNRAQISSICLSIIDIFIKTIEKKILYLDLKPENLVIYGSGNDLKCKLIDFGSCVYYEPESKKISYYKSKEHSLNSRVIVKEDTKGTYQLEFSKIYETALYSPGISASYASPLLLYKNQYTSNNPELIINKLLANIDPYFHSLWEVRITIAVVCSKLPFIPTTIRNKIGYIFESDENTHFFTWLTAYNKELKKMLEYLKITETLFSEYMNELIGVCTTIIERDVGSEYNIEDLLKPLHTIIEQGMKKDTLKKLSNSLITTPMKSISTGAAATAVLPDAPLTPPRSRRSLKPPDAPVKPPNPFPIPW